MAYMPNKHFRLVCWFLTYRIRPRGTDLAPFIPKACQHAKMALEAFEAARQRWPREFEKVLKKRARRRAYLRAHGHVPADWTPPDPKDRRTANRATAALRAHYQRRAWRPVLRRLIEECGKDWDREARRRQRENAKARE